APTGKAGDNQVISRYSAAASASSIPFKGSTGCTASGLIAAARSALRRDGWAFGLFAVMSMGMAMMVVVIAMFVVAMVIVMRAVVVRRAIVRGVFVRGVIVGMALLRLRMAGI